MRSFSIFFPVKIEHLAHKSAQNQLFSLESIHKDCYNLLHRHILRVAFMQSFNGCISRPGRDPATMIASLVSLLLLGCALEAVFIVQEHRKRMLAALLLKGGASLLFVLAGVLAFSRSGNPSFARLIVLGLMFGAVGDVCLNLRFLLTEHARPIFLCGIAAFLLGHVAYLAALIAEAPQALLYALPASALVSFFLIRYVLSRVEVAGAIKTFGIVYLCVVFLMAAAAVTLFVFEPWNAGRAVFAAGALLFAASDVLLVLHQFGKRLYPAFRALNLSLYYLGQVCICLTIALLR